MALASVATRAVLARWTSKIGVPSESMHLLLLNAGPNNKIDGDHRMAKNLASLLKQIAQLQKQADALRSREKAEVIQRIKEAIAHYGITPDELFGVAMAARRPGSTATQSGRKARTSAAKKPVGVAKYTDGAGRTWSGVGKRPNWFKEAIAAGKQAEDLLISR